MDITRPFRFTKPIGRCISGAVDPEFRKKWEALGTPVVAGTPDEFGRLIRTESVRLGRLVRETGVTAD